MPSAACDSLVADEPVVDGIVDTSDTEDELY